VFSDNRVEKMKNVRGSKELFESLNDATAREMKVSMQYMMQHTLYSGGGSVVETKSLGTRAGKFVASHSPVFLPGKSLKKIAVAEMKHAEAIAERVSSLGGEPTTQPAPFKIGKTLKEILGIDKAEEETAINLYNQIIAKAGQEGDETTERLFRRILSDEEKHHQIFTSLLETVIE